MIRWTRPLTALAVTAFAVSGCSDGARIPTAPFDRVVEPFAAVTPSVLATLTPPTNGATGVATYVLYAGQTQPVGEVMVSNDGTDLFISVDLETGFCLTETHLALATAKEDLPGYGSRGGPAPGQFPNAVPLDDPDGCDETPGPFSIALADLGVVAGQTVYIALHAVVVDLTNPVLAGLPSRAGVDVYGPLTTYSGPAGPWGSPVPAQVVSVPNGAWVWTHPQGEWISRLASAASVDPTRDEWLRFSEVIVIPAGVYAPRLVVVSNSDNAEEFFLNGSSRYAVGTVDPAGDPPVRGAFAYDSGERTFDLLEGDNQLDFIVRNYFPPPPGTGPNPTALIYTARASYYPTETAWAGTADCTVEGVEVSDNNEIGCDFPGSNWATFVAFEVRGAYCPALTLDDVVVLDATGDLNITNGVTESPYVQAFFESLWQPDPAGTTSFQAYAELQSGSIGSTITVDAPVCSYYFFFDPSGSSGGSAAAKVTLPGDLFVGMRGIKGKDPNNDPLDGILGPAGVIYPTGIDRWLEPRPDPNADNVDDLGASPDQIQINLKVGGTYVDHFRIFTGVVY